MQTEFYARTKANKTKDLAKQGQSQITRHIHIQGQSRRYPRVSGVLWYPKNCVSRIRTGRTNNAKRVSSRRSPLTAWCSPTQKTRPLDGEKLAVAMSIPFIAPDADFPVKIWNCSRLPIYLLSGYALLAAFSCFQDWRRHWNDPVFRVEKRECRTQQRNWTSSKRNLPEIYSPVETLG